MANIMLEEQHTGTSSERFSQRSSSRDGLSVALPKISAFQDLLNGLDVVHSLRRVDNGTFHFPDDQTLLKLYEHQQLYDFLRSEDLVILQDDPRTIRLDNIAPWGNFLNHDWHLIIDMNTHRQVQVLFRERVNLLIGCIQSKNAEIDADHQRIHMERVWDAGDVIRRLNKVLRREGIALQAIADGADIFFEQADESVELEEAS